MPELVLAFENRSALLEEYDKNLAHGRAFVKGAFGLAVFSPCTLTIEHPETLHRQSFACEVVMVLEHGSQRGTAVQFSDRSEDNLERLKRFVADQGQAPPAPESGLSGFEDEVTGLKSASGSPPEDEPEYDAFDEQTSPFGSVDDDGESEQMAGNEASAEADDGTLSGEGGEADDDEGPPTQQRSNVAARALKLKNLNPQQRMLMARSSVQEERVLLERIYGSAVWELLLHNPKITIPEVARMARKGTMPRPLLELIADNEQWVRHSLVRRALLANPRLGGDSAVKVLRTLPPRELKLVPQQTAYPASVRQAATRLMRGS
jgi:hypothetical protein